MTSNFGKARILRRISGALTLLMLAGAIGGCATIKGWFSDVKKENIQPPTPLVEPAPAIVTVQKLWDERVGKGADATGVRMAPYYADGKLYAIGSDGTIAAFDAGSGHTLWSKHLGKRHGWILHHGKNSVRFAGGPVVDGNLLVAGTSEGVVEAFDAGSGTERWHAEVSSEVIAPPAIADGIVVVRTNDGRLYGFDANDGSRKWVYDRSTVPALSLRGNGTPRIVEGVVYAGEDNGKVIALRLADGNLLWEQTLSPGEGRSEIERLQDVDGGLVVDNGVVYASAYRGLVAALIAQSGRPLWTHNLSGYTGVSLAPTQVYAVDSDSVVWALDLRTGSSDWKNDTLKYRWLTGASAMGDYIVTGDLDGYVHWLAASDGKLAARVRLSKHAIQAAPVVVGDTVYVEDIDGRIGAYRLGK
jgi:outer membrane protein assembly factor BamB